MSTTETEVSRNEVAASTPVPKRITNAQTVCNERNEKGKLCNGHLKQLRTAGEPAEIHLRGDDVLSKCQTCGTYYMGPPLGHVRDPNKQVRFVEAELTALLQAAGGTLPVVKKDARGVFVMEETTAHAPAEKPAAAKPAATASATQTAAPAKAAAKPAAKPAVSHKGSPNPNRALFKRTTYAGVQDTGPVAGETFEQKVARLRAVAAGAKQRADEGGGEAAAETSEVLEAAMIPPPDTAPVDAPPTAPAAAAPATSSPVHKPTGQADRTLFRRSTYCGVTDTGPVPGESFQDKVARLAKVSAAAKQRSEEG
jgi:hypothetical protein